ncbi:MAG: type III toxin-antitoxin system ToxN/AbiQ family toxin [Clostridiales bacterium]|nr:type III toxin-antitoxin system ToxN/AbiQ family toxin [Clostridiales bacterium]
MEQKRLNLYLIDMKYIRNLAKADDKVMSVSPQVDKATRPFVGIVIICGEQKYCIPLSSPKPKHKSMKNDVDFMKILDKDKLIGILNFNNMIPVDDSCISLLNLRISGNDDMATKNYKKMAVKQLDWCQHNQAAIVKKANKLYMMLQYDKVSGILKRRCCDFKKLEIVKQKWVEKQQKGH